jgi:hypothetical protein
MGNDCCPRIARAGTDTGCDGVVVAASAGSISKNFLAQLGKNFCNFVEHIIAVSAAKLVNAGFVPTFVFVIIDDRSLDFDRVEFSIEIGIEEEGK